jgi:hypothetical protein
MGQIYEVCFHSGIASRGRLIRWLFLISLLLVTPLFAYDGAASPELRYLSRSTVKLQQLLGETDKQLHKPTLSQTETRYRIKGTDLGYSFESGGRAYFLFGDTVGSLADTQDTMASTNATMPEQGVRLDFLTSPGQPYLTISPPGLSMGGFETPIGGINIVDRIFLAVRTNHAADWSTDRSVLVDFTLPSTFKALRILSQAPAGKFLTLSIHAEPAAKAPPGLPPGGPFVFIWGTGHYRGSDAFLMIVPVANLASGKDTLYFRGFDAANAPIWSPEEQQAEPIVKNGTMGDISVTWCDRLGLWLMTYDSRRPAAEGIMFSSSATPWGPWSEPQVIFEAERDGAMGKFIHDPASRPDDGLAGPVIGKRAADPGAVRGGAYAPYVVERWTKAEGNVLSLYYVISTWNPYVVDLLRSRFEIR